MLQLIDKGNELEKVDATLIRYEVSGGGAPTVGKRVKVTRLQGRRLSVFAGEVLQNDPGPPPTVSLRFRGGGREITSTCRYVAEGEGTRVEHRMPGLFVRTPIVTGRLELTPGSY